VSDEAKRQAIRGIDRRERQVGLIAAGLAGVIALSTTLPYVLKPSMKVSVTVAASKNHTCAKHYQYVNGKCDGKVAYSLDHWVFAMCILLAFAVAIFVTVRVGRRSPLGFVSLMAGLAYETYVGILGLPFIAAGGWLLIRAWRVQRYGSPTATKSNPSGERGPPPTRAERQTKAKKAKTPVPAGPVASKRYTPKTAKKKRPVPTPKES